MKKKIKQKQNPKKKVVVVKQTVRTPEELIQYRETLKYNTWVKVFLDPTNKETFGNATQSALLAYKLDKNKQYDTASVMGHDNLRKLKSLSSIILEKSGYSFEKLMTIGAKKMEAGDYDVWEKFMTRLGYFETNGQQAQTLNQFNINLGDRIAQDRANRGLPTEVINENK